MLPSSNVVKDTAKTAMKGKGVLLFGAASVITAVVLFMYVVLGTTYTVFGALGESLFMCGFVLFVLMPLLLGFVRFFKGVAFETAENVTEIFYYFTTKNLYFRAFSFSVLLFIRMVLVSVVFFLPAIVSRMLTSNSFYNFFGSSMPFWAGGLGVVTTLLKICGGIAVFIALLKYYIAPFMFVSNDDMEPESIIELSTVVSKSTKIDYLWLLLSLVLYIVLAIFVLPLPFTLPTVTMCYVVHCRYAVAKYNIALKDFKSNQNI